MSGINRVYIIKQRSHPTAGIFRDVYKLSPLIYVSHTKYCS